MHLKKYKIFCIILTLVASGYLLITNNVFASQIDDLKIKINERNIEIEKIQKEIDAYQAQIDKTSEQASTLKNEIKRLEATKKKLSSNIYLTQNNINKTNLNIEKLNLQIEDTNVGLSNKKIMLGEILRNINEAESASMLEITLANDNLSDFFSDIEDMKNLQDKVNANLNELKSLKIVLQDEETEKESEKKNLLNLKSTYTDQKQLVELNKSKTNQILAETKNKEANYKKLLEEKKRIKEALENEITEYESKLKIIIDPSSLPKSGSGVLKWPLVKIFITQKFGVTADSVRLYTSGSHNGVDFRASEGTKVMSAGNGTVVSTGDTDKTCPGASFGKWVLIDFHNGLSAIFAHLSLIKVSPGQNVTTGEIIGYSGNTGYSTGPHLHVTVYASKGVQIQTRPSKACSGRSYTMPLAPLNAYLDPLLYF